MIVTCTLNPAIDLYIKTSQLLPGTVNRTEYSQIMPNGKGVNVSFVLKKLGIDTKAIGIGGGFTNQFIEDSLTEQGIEPDFIHTAEPSRINVFTQVVQAKEEYKLVNKGPEVSATLVEALLKKISLLGEADYFILSGSFAQGISPNIIKEIAQLSQKNHFQLILDVSYQEIKEAFAYQPLLIKPNIDELFSWYGQKNDGKLSSILALVKKTLAAGVQNILLSLGEEGAIIADAKQILIGNAPAGKVVNTACAGDTMLATFVAGMQQGMSRADNLKRSIAAGSSTAFSVGLTDFKDVDTLSQQIKIQKIAERLGNQ